MGNIRLRAGFRVAAAIAALALPLTVAGTAFADPPGDNGDVKIHQVGAKDDEQDNDPHVCHFYLDAFNFDGLQQVSWTISPQAPGGAGSLSGAITLEASGDGHTGTLNLPDGHYKLDWTFVGEHGNGKHKVFWVDCGTPNGSTGGTGGSGGGPTSTPSSSASGSQGGSSTGGSTGGKPSSGPSGKPSTTPSGAPSSQPSTPNPSASTTPPSTDSSSSPSTGKLAHTGANGSALIYAAIGAAALAGGGYGLRRYASARSKS